ncbi:sulfate adenylyltransferase subunit 1 [Campylobacterota bacterium]|nr:sulfate adenylyltransferase subunit 1 [Campylobacterota bacterium]
MSAATEYLQANERKELLRFITCGSVDDGKSTLIGRLLHDSKMIYEDQLQSIRNDTKKVGNVGEDEELDLALLVDGLQAEREQGITIDVAYRYFSTEKRKFIIADTPGHEQYTRNMATGASTADLAIILIDARKGVLTQTKRHSYIVHLLGIKTVAVAINKMDMVGYSQEIYNKIAEDYSVIASQLGIANVTFFPVSALKGDNIVSISKRTEWYKGEALISYLESVDIAYNHSDKFRFPVQYVIRPDLTFRGFSGTVAGGEIVVGEQVRVLPSNKLSHITRIVTYNGDVVSASKDMAVTLTLADEIDISRGDVIIRNNDPTPFVADDFEADIVWLGEEKLDLQRSYLIKIGTKTTSAKITDLIRQIDINNFGELCEKEIKLNAIAHIKLSTLGAVVFDPYYANRLTGSFILIDRLTNATVCAGMARKPVATADALSKISGNFSTFELELNALIRRHFPHWDAVDLSKIGA